MEPDVSEKIDERTPEQVLEDEIRTENIKKASDLLRRTIVRLEEEYNVRFTLVNFGVGFVQKEEDERRRD